MSRAIDTRNNPISATGITIDVQGPTLIVTGQLSHEKDRNVILSCLLEGALPKRVVDSLHVAGEIPSTQVYMTQGGALSRTIEQYFNEELTWEQYKAAKENAKRR